MALYMRKNVLQGGRITKLSEEAIKSVEDKNTGAKKINEIVSITQAEYDAIPEPDPQTLYVVVG